MIPPKRRVGYPMITSAPQSATMNRVAFRATTLPSFLTMLRGYTCMSVVTHNDSSLVIVTVTGVITCHSLHCRCVLFYRSSGRSQYSRSVLQRYY
jgi:hypothetical protein